MPQSFLDELRKFCALSLAPGAGQADLDEAFAPDVLRKSREVGVWGMLLPKLFGGLELSQSEYCNALIELGKSDASFALMIAAHSSLCSNHILMFGTDEQKERYLPLLASGDWIGSWALTEVEAGSDAGGITTKAHSVGASWVLNGKKRFITNAASAKLSVILGTTTGAKDGITAFLVESSNPGRTLDSRIRTMGMRASETFAVNLTDCSVTCDSVLGEVGGGLSSAFAILNGGRLSIAALSIGIALGAYETALAHTRSRRQFGKPLIDLPGVRERLVSMYVEIETAKAMLERAIRVRADSNDFATASATAKLVASEAAVNVSDIALQLQGGAGYTAGSKAERFYRDSKLCTIGEGTSEVLRIVIGRSIAAPATPR